MPRRPSCKSYGECLDIAAFSNRDLECEGCENYKHGRIETTPEEMEIEASRCKTLILAAIGDMV
uniref:Uncharacterized protein n=1 Tax=viral metagenome TaxID=1070528 RepID=A0A6M3LQZ5_9ZZZZ